MAQNINVVSKSTGPRTVKGKEISRRNALTHGIFSTSVVISDESQADFDALHNGLRKCFRPAGVFEDELVKILAETRWRQRRLLLAEEG